MSGLRLDCILFALYVSGWQNLVGWNFLLAMFWFWKFGFLFVICVGLGEFGFVYFGVCFCLHIWLTLLV